MHPPPRLAVGTSCLWLWRKQALLTGCQVRGAPISVTVHGQKQLISSDSRNAVDVFLELWLAASSAMDEGVRASVDGEGVAKTSDIAAEVCVSVSACPQVCFL